MVRVTHMIGCGNVRRRLWIGLVAAKGQLQPQVPEAVGRNDSSDPCCRLLSLAQCISLCEPNLLDACHLAARRAATNPFDAGRQTATQLFAMELTSDTREV